MGWGYSRLMAAGNRQVAPHLSAGFLRVYSFLRLNGCCYGRRMM